MGVAILASCACNPDTFKRRKSVAIMTINFFAILVLPFMIMDKKVPLSLIQPSQALWSPTLPTPPERLRRLDHSFGDGARSRLKNQGDLLLCSNYLKILLSS